MNEWAIVAMFAIGVIGVVTVIVRIFPQPRQPLSTEQKSAIALQVLQIGTNSELKASASEYLQDVFTERRSAAEIIGTMMDVTKTA